MKRLIYITIFFASLLVCSCSTSNTPQSVVENVYQSIKDKNYDKVAQYLYVDSIEPLTTEESKLFTTMLSDIYKNFPEYYQVDVVAKDSTISEGKVIKTVNIKTANGENFTEKLTLVQDNGDWKIRVFRTQQEIENDSTPKSNAPVTKTYKMLDAIKFCYDRILADRGIPRFICYLAIDYYNGIYVNQDAKKYYELELKAADKGYVQAMNSVGWCYQNGFGVLRDFEKAIDWYKKAADKGNKIAPLNLGMLYFNMGNWQAAYKMFSKIDKDSEAQFWIGVMYEGGLYVKQDQQKAYEWFKKSADQGNPKGLSKVNPQALQNRQQSKTVVDGNTTTNYYY